MNFKNCLLTIGLAICFGQGIREARAESLEDLQNQCFSAVRSRFPNSKQLPFQCYSIQYQCSYDAAMAYANWARIANVEVFSAITKIETRGQANCVQRVLNEYRAFTLDFIKTACSI